jgi:WD40 repeat protein
MGSMLSDSFIRLLCTCLLMLGIYHCSWIWDGGNIIILNATTGIQTAILSGHTISVCSITYSSNGIFLVSGSHDKTVKLWDVQTGGLVKTFYGHTGSVLSVSISADCTRIASGSSDCTIHLWDIQTGECYCVITRGYVRNVLASLPQIHNTSSPYAMAKSGSGTSMVTK